MRAFYTHLLRVLPVDGGVTLRVKRPLMFEGEGCLGLTFLGGGKRATIQLDNHFDESVVWNTLIHEYAHALSGDGTHGRRWADAHGKVYRAWEKWRDIE
jgi:hypothetical protein